MASKVSHPQMSLFISGWRIVIKWLRGYRSINAIAIPIARRIVARFSAVVLMLICLGLANHTCQHPFTIPVYIYIIISSTLPGHVLNYFF